MNRKRKCHVIIHTPNRGGAGKYNQSLLTSLKMIFDETEVMGFTEGYDIDGCVLTQVSPVLMQTPMPLYQGVHYLRKLYAFSLAILRWHKIKHLISKIDVDTTDLVVFTSSIQILQAYLLLKANPSLNVILIIQENLPLKGLSRLLVRRYVELGGEIVGINNSWVSFARQELVSLHYLPNPFEFDASLKVPNEYEKKYDLIYVGGESRLKGFGTLVSALRLGERKLNIALLGGYTDKARGQILELVAEKPNLSINIVGNVPSITSYLVKSRIILLPIERYHFCRPAIEAGLYNVPILVSDFAENDDFSTKDSRFTFEAGDAESMLSKIDLILDSPDVAIYKAQKQHDFSNTFLEKNDFHRSLEEIVNEIID